MERASYLGRFFAPAYCGGGAVYSPSRVFLNFFGCLVLALSPLFDGGSASATSLEELERRISSLEDGSSSSTCAVDPKKRIGIKCPKWSASIFGRLYVDTMAFSEDSTAKDQVKDGDAKNDPGLKDTSNVRIRTARIGIAGKYMDTWGFKVEADVSSNSSQLKDGYLSYIGIKGLKVNIGQGKVPYSMEELTSSRHINFIERVTPSGFSPDRVIGVAAFYGRDNWSFGASAHGEGHDDKGDSKTYQAEWGTTARATWAPIYNKGKEYIHVGFGVRHVNYPSQDKASVGFSSRSPFSNAFDFKSAKNAGLSAVDEVAGVTAGEIFKTDGDANQAQFLFEEMFGWNGEFAAGYGSMGIKAQYIRADVDSALDLTKGEWSPALRKETEGFKSSYELDSWYVSANWWLTGEANAYNPKKGTFGRIKPLNNLADGGIGAVGAAIRYNEVTFGKREDVKFLNCNDGCETRAWTVNLTWKPNPYVKFLAEYVRAERKRVGVAAIPDPYKDIPTAFQLRAMVDF